MKSEALYSWRIAPYFIPHTSEAWSTSTTGHTSSGPGSCSKVAAVALDLLISYVTETRMKKLKEYEKTNNLKLKRKQDFPEHS